MNRTMLWIREKGWLTFQKACLVIVSLILCHIMLEISCIEENPWTVFQRLAGIRADYTAMNLLSLGALLAVIWILISRVWLACLLTTVFCGIIGIINHYVSLFHTMPLSFMVLRNFATAMDAVGSYQIRPDAISTAVAVVMLVGVLLCILGRKYTVELRKKGNGTIRLLWKVVLCLLSIAFLYQCYFSENAWSPRGGMGWSWKESYKTYGYTVSTFESLYKSTHVVTKPEGYSESGVQNLTIGTGGKTDAVKPDIILILNESFYDLRQITDVPTDIPFLENIDNMDNLLRGYAVIPGVGGGTNNSEYELLTSNSMWLISGTPFNYMNMYGASSIVSHLNELGYDTLGTHSESGANYSRIRGYQGLDFRKCYFEEYYEQVEYIPSRQYETDESLYRNLICWYEEAPEDQPRFLYMLTIQNHGEWNWSDPEVDIVHTTKDYGKRTQDVNEYLTGIYYSDKAFVGLTEYFSQVDRPVVLCMVGDHAPNFAPEIADGVKSDEERELALRKVPLMIWANYPLREQKLGTMSMNFVVPTLLDIAGVQTSPYYSYLLELKQQLPVISSYGQYYDFQGDVFSYNSDVGMEYENLVDQYFWIEYHKIESDKNRDWFIPYEE